MMTYAYLLQGLLFEYLFSLRLNLSYLFYGKNLNDFRDAVRLNGMQVTDYFQQVELLDKQITFIVEFKGN